MSDGNPDFYGETIDRLLSEGQIALHHTVLVVCGGQVDRRIFDDRGFTDVTISNLDTRLEPDEFAPYSWAHQDAEDLTYDDGSFDWVVVHSGLHHCRSPHRGLVEMYRVARRGVLLFEPYDNVVTRLGLRLNLGQEYEHHSVAHHGFEFGGVANTSIPNFVYRFTTKEIEKAINCYDPTAKQSIRYFHRLRIPWGALKARPSKTAYVVAKALSPLLRLLEVTVPRAGNNFGALVLKPEPDDLHPWLRREGEELVPDRSWINARFGG